MYIVCTALYFLLATAVAGKESAKGETSYAGTDCRKYSAIGTVLQCAGSQYTARTITNTTLLQYIDFVRDKIAPDTMYYSAGISTGTDIRVVAGVQKNPSFVKQVSMSIDPRKAYTQGYLFDMGISLRKPILVFAINANQFDLPQLPKYLTTATTVRGSSDLPRVFASSFVDDFTPHSDAKCEEWYANWEIRAEFEKMDGVAIVMHPEHWCPQAAKGKFDVIITKFKSIEDDARLGKVLIPEWTYHAQKTYGTVPSDFQVFQ